MHYFHFLNIENQMFRHLQVHETNVNKQCLVLAVSKDFSAVFAAGSKNIAASLE